MTADIKALDASTLIPLPSNIVSLPDGWLSGFESVLLYNAARLIGGGSILEVGSWIGRSSCVIAYAAHDSETERPRYDIVDYGIAGIDEWHARFGGNVLTHPAARAILEVICHPGGTLALLKKNLVDRDLSKFVTTIVCGDLKDYMTNIKYDLIFCDATHDEAEIIKNVPILANFLKDNFIMLCDDIISVKNANLVASLTEADRIYISNETDQYSKISIFTRGIYKASFG